MSLTVTPGRKFANVAQSQTDAVIAAAVPDRRLRVLAFICHAGAAATPVTFNSKGAGAGTAISATFANGAHGIAAGQYNPDGWFETNEGEALTVTTGAGAATGIQVVYGEV